MTDKAVNFIKANRALLVILGLAVLLRIVYLYQYQLLPDWRQLTVDNYYHLHWAQSIAGGNIFGDTTYFRAPFYVYCLAVLYAVLGASLWVGRIFGVVVGLASIVMTYLLGRSIFDRKVGLIAGAIHAVYPITLYFEAELLLDPLFMLLTQASMYWLLRWMDAPRSRDLFITGLLFGLAAITRPTILVFVPVVILIVLFRSGVASRWRQLGLLILGMTIMIGPITARNILVASDPVLISSQGGINFYIGNNDEADGVTAAMPEPLGPHWQIEDVTYIAEKGTGRKLLPGEISSYWFGRGLAWAVDHPGSFMRLGVIKLYYSIANLEVSNNRSLPDFMRRIPVLRYNPLTFSLVFTFAVIGFVLGFSRWEKLRWLLLLICCYTLGSALFFFNSRFRLPLLPYYMVAASFGLTALGGLLAANWRRALVVVAGGVLVLLLSLFPQLPQRREIDTSDLLSKGLMALHDGQFDQAIRTYHRALQYNETFPTTNLNLGICFLRMGMEDSARFYLDREKRLHPRRARGWINTASLHLINNRPDSALSDIATALDLRPYDVTANMIRLRASLADSLIDIDSLKQIALASARATDDNLFLLNEAAVVLLNRGEIVVSEQLLKRAARGKAKPIEMDDSAFDADFANSPENVRHARAQSYYQLGFLTGRLGRFFQSVDYSKTAIRLNPDLVEAYVNLVSGYGSIGSYSKADSTLQDAADRFPSDPRIQRLQQMMRQ